MYLSIFARNSTRNTIIETGDAMQVVSLRKLIMSEILQFVNSKKKYFFTYEEFCVYMYYKHRHVKFTSIARILRKLAKDGYLYRLRKKLPQYNFTQYTVFYPNILKIKKALR